jgi:hypothetical protein
VPLNVHRWRALADTDPPRWAALLRVHALQRELAAARAGVVDADAAVAAREAEVEALGKRVARQPLQVSTLIIEANQLHSLLPGGEAHEESAAHRRRRLKKEKEQRRNRLVQKYNSGVTAKIWALFLGLVVLFILLPTDVQNFLVNQLVPVIWGAWVLGMSTLWGLNPAAKHRQPFVNTLAVSCRGRCPSSSCPRIAKTWRGN